MTRAQVLGQEAKIALGGGDLRVAKDHREPHNIPTMAQVISRERVPESMPKPNVGCPSFSCRRCEPRKAISLVPRAALA